MTVLLTLLGGSHLGAILTAEEARTVNTLLNVIGLIIPAYLLFKTKSQDRKLGHIERMTELERDHRDRERSEAGPKFGRRKADRDRKPEATDNGNES